MDLPKTDSIIPEEIETINLLLSNHHHNETLLELLNQLRAKLPKNKDSIVYRLLRPPFALFRFLDTKYESIKKINDRVYIINKEFVYKYDEQRKANYLSFISTLFAKACKIKTPNMVLANLHDFDFRPKYTNEEKSVQIMDYLPSWQDYSSEHQRGPKFGPQLASLLAFDLVIANSDRFLFIFRFIDNILFVDDPEYEQMDLWLDPIINEGNFGFIGLDLWSLDCRADKLDYILKVHRLLDDEFLKKCSRLMGQFFKLNRNEILTFEDKLNKYVSRYLELFPKFLQLYHIVHF